MREGGTLNQQNKSFLNEPVWQDSFASYLGTFAHISKKGSN